MPDENEGFVPEQMDPLFPELGQPRADTGESESLMENEARRDERARLLAAARQAVVTYSGPGLGNGPEHGQHVKVVPWSVLEELLGEEGL